MSLDHNFNIGDIIKLNEGVERAFSDCNIGEVTGFFTAPLLNLDGVQYAEVAWEDGTESSIPVGQIQHFDYNDSVDGLLLDDCDCDADDDLGDFF